MKVMLFPNGNTAVFEEGKQVPPLQESWFLMYVRFLAALGYKPSEIIFILPDGRKAKVFNTSEGGYNWSIE